MADTVYSLWVPNVDGDYAKALASGAKSLSAPALSGGAAPPSVNAG